MCTALQAYECEIQSQNRVHTELAAPEDFDCECELLTEFEGSCSGLRSVAQASKIKMWILFFGWFSYCVYKTGVLHSNHLIRVTSSVFKRLDQYLIHYPVWDQFLMGQLEGNIVHRICNELDWKYSFCHLFNEQETKDKSFDLFASLILTDNSQLTIWLDFWIKLKKKNLKQPGKSPRPEMLCFIATKYMQVSVASVHAQMYALNIIWFGKGKECFLPSNVNLHIYPFDFTFSCMRFCLNW